MSGIVNHPVDAGMWNFITWLKGITNIRHGSPCHSSYCCGLVLCNGICREQFAEAPSMVSHPP
jgi:hypothetical protein